MVSLKTVGTSVTALMRLDKQGKRGRNRLSDSGYFLRPLHPPSNPQQRLESHFIDRDNRQRRYDHSSRYNAHTKRGSNSGTTPGKTEALGETMRSEGKEKLRKLRRRNFPGSLTLNQQAPAGESEGLKEISPLQRFQKAGRKIMMMVHVVGAKKERPKETDRNMLSWTTICDDLGFTRTRYNTHGLTFDPADFKVKKKGHISSEAIETLCLNPRERSDEQIRHCLVSLNTTVPQFSEFPIKMQTSLVQVGWYEKFEPGRVIIRQGQRADNFYMILSGTAVVTILETKPKKKTKRVSRAVIGLEERKGEELFEGAWRCQGEEEKGEEPEEQYVRTANILEKGSSFGELALIQGSIRTATVTCRGTVELLALDRDDYIDIFMKADKGREPEHIQFIKRMNIFQGWPVELLPWNDPTVCAFTYVRRDTVMCADSSQSDDIFIIMTGTCHVLKSLPAVKPKLYRSEVKDYGIHTPRTNRMENIRVRQPVTKKHAKPSTIQFPTKTNLEANIALSSSTVHHKEQEDGLKHEDMINKAFNKRHHLPPLDTSSLKEKNHVTSLEEEEEEEEKEKVYIQMTKLGRGDVFGLDEVLMTGIRETTSSILISDGAECILLNKHFFRKYLTQPVAKQMRKKIQPFPSEKRLQQKLQTQIDWEEFKNLTVLDYIDFNNHVQNVSWKH